MEKIFINKWTAFQADSRNGRFFPIDRFDGLAIGVQLAIFLLLALTPLAPNKYGDGDFHREAKIISDVLHGSRSIGDISLDRALGPTLYYALPYSMLPVGSTDENYWLAGFIWTMFWMSVSLLLVRRAAENYLGALGGIFALALTVCSPFQVYYSYGILAESPAYLGVVLLVYGSSLLRLPAQNRKTAWRAGALLYCGMLLFLLSRPNALLLLGVAGASLLLLVKRPAYASRIHLAGILGVVFALLLSAGAAKIAGNRNSERGQQDYFMHVAFHGRFQFRDEPWNWSFWDPRTRQGSVDFEHFVAEHARLDLEARATGAKLSSLQRDWIVEDVVSHPWLAFRQAWVRALNIHIPLVGSMAPGNFRFGPLTGMAGYVLFHAVVDMVVLFTLAGALLWMGIHRKGLVELWPLWGPWAALLAFHALIYAEPRYLFPARPGLVLMASMFYVPWLRDRFGRLKNPAGIRLDRQVISS